MGSLTIVKPGLYTSIQDVGRKGLAYYAIPRSGPMDMFACELANALLSNDRGAATIECNLIPPTLRFETAAHIVVTGAEMNWRINGVSIERNQTIFVSAESTLTGSPASEGFRGYIGIKGTIETEKSFGSASCYELCELGGNNGKPLRAGDKFRWIDNPSESNVSFNLESDSEEFDRIQIIQGPEYKWLNEKSKRKLVRKKFRITSDSNRMGARLKGPVLSTDGETLIDSLPLLPGMVQLIPSGQLIVVLQDGQTTGGYPRIAYIPALALRKLNQLPFGSEFHFYLDGKSV